MRVPPSTRISPRQRQGSSFRPLIPLDNTVAAGGLEAAAQLAGLIGTAEGAGHGAEIGAFFPEFDPADHRLAAAKLGGEFALRTSERGLRLGFATLRGNLHIAAGPAAGCRRHRRRLLRRCRT